MDNQGIKHPQANGEVERQNQPLLKRIQIAHAEKKDWKKELNTYLAAYRSLPHPTTGVSPAELLFGRKICRQQFGRAVPRRRSIFPQHFTC